MSPDGPPYSPISLDTTLVVGVGRQTGFLRRAVVEEVTHRKAHI